jgi:DtxR family Mn-dependent transcriptional regulator
MGVSGPTVTATLRRLESHGLVERNGTDVVLTAEGSAQAIAIVRKHRISEKFLVDVLGFDWEAAHEEACRLEHALSPRVVDALQTLLENPDVCPHGHPIPSADGQVAPAAGTLLADVAVGASVTVLRVSEDENLLGYLAEAGLVPGAVVRVAGSEPFGGPLTIEVSGGTRALAREVAQHVVVE